MSLCICIRVDSTTLANRDYELVPEHEAQVNYTEAEEDLNQHSEEPKANPEQEGKHRSIIPPF